MRAWNPKLETLRRVWLLAPALAAAVGVFLLPAPWSVRFLGLAVAWFLSAFVGPVAKWAVADRAVPNLSTANGELTPIEWGSGRRGPFVLGVAEATLFYASFVAHAPELAGAWLLFKTAAKWAAWQHIMLMPQTLKGVNEIDFLEYRHAFSSKVATLFMIGTLGNGLAGAVGYLAIQVFSRAS